MKVIQLIQKPQARGAEIFAAQLSAGLERKGHQVLLVSLFQGDFKLPFSGTQIHLGRPIHKRLWDTIGWKQLGKLISEFEPDLVQANGADTLKFSVFTRLLFGGNYTLIFNNGGVVSTYLRSWGQRHFNRFLLRHVNALISVTRFSQIDLDKVLGFSRPHTVISVGIELSTLPIVPEALPGPVLVHVGGFTTEKNHEGLLRIFGEFLKVYPESQLWLIGDGPVRGQIEGLVTQVGFGAKVKFFGAVASPFSLIPRNAILVLPSKIEGLPAVILEAFQAGIGVVAYQVGGIQEVVISRQTGFLVSEGNEKEFVEALIQCFRLAPAAKEQLMANASELVQKYSMNSVTGQFEAFYQSLCGSSN